MLRRNLTPLQEQGVVFIRSEVKAGRGVPSNRKIGEYIKRPTEKAADICMSLFDMGLLCRDERVGLNVDGSRQKLFWGLPEDA